MRGIGQDGQQSWIAPTAPAILRRTVPFAGDAGGIAVAIDRWLLALDHDRMLPVVAEVVGIGEAGYTRTQHPIHRQPLLVGRIVDLVRIAVLPAGDVERMQVGVIPTHRGLNDMVKVTQRHPARHPEPAPAGGRIPRSVTFRLTMPSAWRVALAMLEPSLTSGGAPVCSRTPGPLQPAG